jgi:AraC-like DNA-binding protein
MLWRSSLHAIPLSRPPAILRMSGRNVHGLRGDEHYRLDRFWCLNLFQGEGELHIGDDVFPFRSGYAGITWPGVDLVYSFRGKTIKTWTHFVPHGGGAAAQIPVMQDVGREFDRLRTDLQSVSSLFRAEPTRAVALLWDILWRLVPIGGTKPSDEPHRNPVVAEAMSFIDLHLGEPSSVGTLARRVGTSQTHLNRLFRAAVGTTAGDYIRRRRLEWARHLLAHTTMPVKAVAYQVGIPDPQHFNKTMRRYFGKPPSALRSAGTTP